MSDSAEGRQVGFPPLTDAHRPSVKATLGPLVAVANPLDYHTFIWNNQPAMTAAFTAMVSGGFDLNMLVLDFPRGDRCSDADWWPTVNAFEAALNTNKARGAVVASMLENLPEQQAADSARAASCRCTALSKRWMPPKRRPASARRGRGPSRRCRAGDAAGAVETRRAVLQQRTAACARRGRGKGIAGESRAASPSGAPRRQCGGSRRCGGALGFPSR